MSISSIVWILIWLWVGVTMASLLFMIMKLKYVRGSHPRYVYATLEQACEIARIILPLVIAGFKAAQGDMVFAGFLLVASMVSLWSFLRHFDDDDHWFNDQWKRLKRGFKKLRQNLANASPLPSPSSA